MPKDLFLTKLKQHYFITGIEIVHLLLGKGRAHPGQVQSVTDVGFHESTIKSIRFHAFHNFIPSSEACKDLSHKIAQNVQNSPVNSGFKPT